MAINVSVLKVKCPTCSADSIWNKENPFRPFCSDRCRLIDLGEWLCEKHVIPGPQFATLEKE